MILTHEEEKMVKGEFGHAVQKTMELLVSLGEIYCAKKMVEIGSAHLAGTGAESAGEAGTDFVEEMCKGGGRFRAWATLNTGSADFTRWKQIGLSEEVVQKQLRLSDLFRRMGSLMTHTCTPYFSLNLPRTHEHVAWGDSSALLFANSVLGARTNRESGPSALAAAVTGRVPLYGLHLKRNRTGGALIRVNARLSHLSDFQALGYEVGKRLKKGIPVFSNLSLRMSLDELRALCALAAPSSIGLFHVVGVTPEARSLADVFPKGIPEDEIVIDDRTLAKTIEHLNTATSDETGLVAFGCPHASIQEILHISRVLEGRKISAKSKLWIFTSAAIKSMADQAGCTNTIERAGGLVISDTCPNLLPDRLYTDQGIHCITTDSAMILHYLSVYHGTLNLQSHFGSMERCVEAAIDGKWEE